MKYDFIFGTQVMVSTLYTSVLRGSTPGGHALTKTKSHQCTLFPDKYTATLVFTGKNSFGSYLGK